MPDCNGEGLPTGQEVDPLTEAEALRNHLQEALVRTSRLIAMLKHQKRQQRTVQSAVASLRRLKQLGG
jgi:hypothetical protein